MTLKQILHQLNRRDTHFFSKNLTFTKLTTIFLIILTVIFSVKTIIAQTTTPTPDLNSAAKELGKEIKAQQDAISNGKPNLGSWSQQAMTSNALVLLGSLTGGGIPINEDGSIKTQAFIPGGVLGTATNLVASLYNQPVSGVEYIAQAKDSFLGKPTYAATGFNSLQPILPLWKVLRNVVYILISIFFVIVGIMIMLRVKINPQTVVNIQNSIPKIIISLILVTFSYAIAGLLIDLSKVIYMIVLSFFFSAKGTPLSQDLFTYGWSDVGTASGLPVLSQISNVAKVLYTWVGNQMGIHTSNMSILSEMNFYGIYQLTMNAIPGGYSFVLGELIGQIFLGVLLGGAMNGLVGVVGSDIGSNVGFAVGDILGGLLGWVLIPIIISILVTIWLMKLYFGMLKSYISVVFKIIISPIQIGLGAFPSSKMNFGTWVIDLLSDLLVFPIVSIVLVFINYIAKTVSTNDMWIPSQISLYTSGFNGGVAQVVSAGIGLAGLALLAKLPKLVPEAIFKLKPSPYGTAIGTSISEGFKPIGNFAKATGRTGTKAADDFAGSEKGSKWWNYAITGINKLVNRK